MGMERLLLRQCLAELVALEQHGDSCFVVERFLYDSTNRERETIFAGPLMECLRVIDREHNPQGNWGYALWAVPSRRLCLYLPASGGPSEPAFDTSHELHCRIGKHVGVAIRTHRLAVGPHDFAYVKVPDWLKLTAAHEASLLKRGKHK